MNKRAEEVAKEICSDRDYNDCEAFYIARLLSKEPEFQSPKSEWIECKDCWPENQPRVKRIFIWRDGSTANEFPDQIGRTYHPPIAWMEIPPYVPAESELVRRVQERLRKHGFHESTPPSWSAYFQSLTEAEQELADGK